jgi:DNA-directed RNA polymerase specialized sigma24 family protein
MLENYNKAKRYLRKVDPILYKDILHDAYLNYFRRTGLNLFERSNGNVIGVVKNQWFENLRKGMYKKGGVRFPFQFSPFEDQTITTTTPLDIFIANETYETISNRTLGFQHPSVAAGVLELKYEGYDNEEIAEKLNLSVHQVKRYTKSLKQDRPGQDRLSEVERVKILKLSKEGHTIKEISTRCNRGTSSVWKVLNNKI